jgi:hypothetical protein
MVHQISSRLQKSIIKIGFSPVEVQYLELENLRILLRPAVFIYNSLIIQAMLSSTRRDQNFN